MGNSTPPDCWNEIKSARLQGADYSPTAGLLLEFYIGRGERRWLILNPANSTPIELTESKPNIRGAAVTKPLTLFLRSHFKGHALLGVEHVAGGVRLRFPMDREIVARPAFHEFEIDALAEGKSVRMHLAATAANNEKSEPGLTKRIEKLERALKKVDQELANKRDQIWQRAGEWLLTAQTVDDAPEEFVDCLDAQQTFSWNLNHCFEKAKQIRAKIGGTQSRRDEIAKQLNELTARTAKGEPTAGESRVAPQNEKKDNLLARAGSRGRTFDVGNHLFFIGKSADDNLRLLRAAKAWHLWFHLKDYPGSFGILQINKSEQIADSSLHAAAERLLKTQFGDRASRRRGDKFDILVAECRYVRPIKGDRAGRVNYTHARTLIHQFGRDEQKG